MVSFNASVAGTAAREWTADPRLQGSARLDLAELKREGVRGIVVIAPHPDDETLGAGGLIAEGALLGLDVHIVVVTDGSASHPGAVGLAATRRGELLRAVDILAPAAAISFLGARDGRVLEERNSVRAALADVLDGLGRETLLVVPWPGDGHRDHRVVGEICAQLSTGRSLRLVEYPIWLWHWGTATDPSVPWDRFVLHQVSPSARALKFRAIQQFESQLGDVLLDSFVEHFTGTTEVFVNPASAPLPGSYFDELYERHADPWSFESRWYEKRKRAITIATLPEERYRSALELGCSIGTVTELLAIRCDSVVAVDISAAAVNRARNRLAGALNVEFRQADVAVEFPVGEFDLVVMSEIGYYFDDATLNRILTELLAHLADGGTFVACHWLHSVADYPLNGETVHSALRALPGLTRLVEHREKDFVLEVFSRDPRSVAEREGLLA